MVGRPRSEQARRAILEAALRLCERDGYPNVTLKGIAEEAGTGRQTLYRWWDTKADLLLEAMTYLVESSRAPSQADLQTFLRETFALADGAVGRVVAGLMAEAQSDPALGERLRARLIGPRRATLRAVLERMPPPPGTDLDLLIDMIFGVMWYRLLNRHAPLDASLAEDITTLVARIGASPGPDEERPG
ncbi:TetR/AcrR family transcriptional regulator [Microbispora hainanensis]|jgi:AcrR family transcriptional regulator|uniref:TetR/AcrR family transcriptional regulator n=1 Tax=Microbispora TaxID=2005 RepID=UPI00115B5DFE|nr:MULTISPECIES: TetR/AcrR family transcriptional regulator [Microbispora]NJP23665.1 TetR/AcrR family transcriptional regulator [Microbispora sp. CL1-1]TQS15878.1 TetR/AcrR family transcriptional regulator [Microbispora sp. SCL1-1]